MPIKTWADKHSTLTDGQIFNIIAGRRTPPLDLVEKWANSLGLQGEDQSVFVELAAIAHLPTEVQSYFIRLMWQRREALQRLESLTQEPARRVADKPDRYRP